MHGGTDKDSSGLCQAKHKRARESTLLPPFYKVKKLYYRDRAIREGVVSLYTVCNLFKGAGFKLNRCRAQASVSFAVRCFYFPTHHSLTLR